MAVFIDPEVLRAALDVATDDQLRAEFARRFPECPPSLVDALDDELRAECERRDLSVKRDEDLIAGLNAKVIDTLSAERDDWKRRAEDAEAAAKFKLSGITLDLAASWATHGQRVEFISGDYRVSMPIRLLIAAAAGYSPELGPGIAATKPDNELWGPTLEDLVAGDA